VATLENDDVVRTRTRQAPTSTFVTGNFPDRPWLTVGIAAFIGFLFTMIWSAAFVDRTIGDTVANGVLGYDAKEVPISGIGAGIAFAFAAGLACTFTACNVAAFGAIGPLVGSSETGRAKLARTLKPLAWLSAGMIGISVLYGVIVGLFGTSMPQFSTAATDPGVLSARSWQSLITFGAIGLIMVYMGLAAVGIVRDPLRNVAARWPNSPMVILGVLIGALTIGRPFGLYRKQFRDAAESGNVLYGAAAWTLHSIGNILVMVVIFLALAYGTGGRLQRWLLMKPARLSIFVAVGFIAAGVFTFLYWDVRILARREVIPFYPMIDW
jgi:MFS family permease